MYISQRERIGSVSIHGRLLVDECELKQGFILNERTREVYGCVDEDSYDLKSAFEHLMNDVSGYDEQINKINQSRL